MSIAPRTLIILGLAIGAAGMTGVFSHQWLAAQRAVQLRAEASSPAAQVPQLAMSEVLVAGKDIAVGSFIRADDLVWRAWPSDAVSADYVKPETGSMEDFAGAVARSKIFANEPITLARVVHPGEQGFLAAVLEPGMRAVSVPVDASSGIAGFVFPGDRVDVLLSYRINGQESSEGLGNVRHFSSTLLSAVRVLAVDQSIDNVDGEAMPAKTVTVEVSRKQAEKLALSLEFGSLSLSLRSLVATQMTADAALAEMTDSQDHDSSFTRDVDVMYISSGDSSVTPSQGKKRQVHVLRGKEAEAISF